MGIYWKLGADQRQLSGYQELSGHPCSTSQTNSCQSLGYIIGEFSREVGFQGNFLMGRGKDTIGDHPGNHYGWGRGAENYVFMLQGNQYHLKPQLQLSKIIKLVEAFSYGII